MALAEIAARRLHPLSKLRALRVLVGLALPVAAVLAPQAQPPVSCKYHQGDFSDEWDLTDRSDFFDISHVDCRLAMKSPPTLHIWSVLPPHVGIERSK
jgi:hypothetical protein